MTDDATKQLERWQPKLTRTVTPKSQLLTVRYSPCGKLLAAGGCDGKVYRWDLTAGVSELSPLSGHDGWVQGLAFHPDGRRLFTADSWGRLTCWSYREDAKPLWTVQAAHDGWVRQAAVAPDGKTIATCGADRQIRLWSAGDGQTVQELAGDQDVYSLAFHPDGKALVSGDLKGVVRPEGVEFATASAACSSRALSKTKQTPSCLSPYWSQLRARAKPRSKYPSELRSKVSVVKEPA